MSYNVAGMLPNGQRFKHEGITHVSLIDSETHGPAPKVVSLADGGKVIFISGANVAVAEVEKAG